jgi:hypothetical protein
MTSQIKNKKKFNKNENKQSQNNLEKYGFTNTKVAAQKINNENKQKKNIVLDLENCAKLDIFGFTSE